MTAATAPIRSAACYWYCCGRLIARAESITDPQARRKVAEHKEEHK